jgi:hypothetical protein
MNLEKIKVTTSKQEFSNEMIFFSCFTRVVCPIAPDRTLQHIVGLFAHFCDVRPADFRPVLGKPYRSEKWNVWRRRPTRYRSEKWNVWTPPEVLKHKNGGVRVQG